MWINSYTQYRDFRKVRIHKKMDKNQMEKKEVERELSLLLELTFKLEDELNSVLRVDD